MAVRPLHYDAAIAWTTTMVFRQYRTIHGAVMGGDLLDTLCRAVL
jgi:hypothetical protein